ncbi:hypothetical protein ABEV74_17100 [Paenibacillus cisolokensis]|uniref:hypothetical protein n=1 Tax=Paenibacillus cisolokensis TaxID=1658519 RepID=UPI003D298A7B
MQDWISKAFFGAALAGQYLFAFLAMLFLLRMLPKRLPRWTHLSGAERYGRAVSDRWLRAFGIERDKPAFAEREALLAGCGYTGDAAVYVLARRVIVVTAPAVAAAYVLLDLDAWIRLSPFAVLSGLAVLYGAALWDRIWLRSLSRLRAQRIMKEIYVVSNQLLYLSGSSLHIHAKLMRCLPFTHALRGDMQRLLAEWYHDAEEALRRFKRRIGTDEGVSFVETIDSLRLHDSEDYYRLLRERIQDYKDKLEFAKESRKESASYVLFVLAGIPILYTFQVFIYPWVQEGQKLFSSLNG